MKVWTLDDRCRQMIVDNWNIGVASFPMFVLSYKLISLKPIFKKWNKEIISIIKSLKLMMKLKTNQVLLMVQVKMMILDWRKNAQLLLDKALHMQDQLWRNMVRNKLFKDGDRSIKLFYNIVRLRYASNKITRLGYDNIFS